MSLKEMVLKLNNRNQSVRDSDRNKQKNIEAVFQEVRRVNSTLASWWRASELQRTTDCRKSYLRKPDNKKKQIRLDYMQNVERMLELLFEQL